MKKEKWQMMRWGKASVGIAVLLCLGLIYAWSVFVTPIEATFGWTRAQTSMTFTICMSFFCVGGLFAGYMQARVKPFILLLLSAGSVAVGFFASAEISSLGALYVSYGVCCGFGVGVGYNVVLSCVLEWFPEKTGFLSGILLMGFGFGGSLLGVVAAYLMSIAGWQFAFRIFGIFLAALVAVSAIVLRHPTKEERQRLVPSCLKNKPVLKEYTTKEMLGTSSFYFVFIWLVLITALGLAVVSNAAPLAQTMLADAGLASLAAGCVSGFNGIGRLSSGLLLDIFGSRFSMKLYSTLGFLAGIFMTGAVVLDVFGLLILGFCLSGFAFGGGSPTMSAYTSRVYGLKYYANNFSVMNLCMLAGAFLGSYCMGLIQTHFGYQLIMVGLVIMAVLSFWAEQRIHFHFTGICKKDKS